MGELASKFPACWSISAAAENLTTKQDDNQLLEHILHKIPPSSSTSLPNKAIGEIQS